MANARTQWMTFKDKVRRKLGLGSAPDIRSTWAETPKFVASKHKGDRAQFLDWFDATDSVEGTLKRAEADWAYRFTSWNYFANVQRGSALEIGFGAGRLLLQASKTFKEVTGVDIHQAFDETRSFLADHGVTGDRVRLVNRANLDSIAPASLDFVYSFIVIQHFDRASELWQYLERIQTWLKPGAYAHLYFGKNESPGVRETSGKEFTLRDASLFIHPDTMREKVSALGFEVIEVREKLAKDPFTGQGESMQASIVFQKPVFRKQT